MAEAAAQGGHLTDPLVRRLPALLQDVVERSRGQDLVLYASGLAFYALVSIAPLLIVVVWLTSTLVGDDQIGAMAKQVQRVAPEGLGAHSALQEVAKAGTRAGIPAVIGGLWPATAYGAGVARAFLHLSPRKKSKLKSLRGRGLALMGLLPLFVLGGLVGSFVGNTLVGDEGVARVLGWGVALVTGFVGVFGAILLLYKVFPPDPMPWRSAMRGAAIASAGVSVLSLLYTIYISAGANFSERYATAGIAGLVLLGLWLFLSNILLLVGFQFALEVSD